MSGPHLCKLLVGSVLTAALLSGSGCGDAKEGGKTQPVPSKIGPPIGKSDSDMANPKPDLGKAFGVPNAKVDLAKAKADFSLDADSWHDEWEKRGDAAKTKYKGKIVELTGTVESADDDPYLTVGYIYLKLKKSGIGVRCTLDDLAPWLRVAPGCTVKLKGVQSDLGLDGELYPCIIVESSPNTSLETTATQLAKEFASNKEAAKKKYHKKRLIVEGEFVGKEPSKADKGQFVYLTLKGDGAVNVRCYVANNSEQRQKANDDLKVGQKVKVCGEAEIDVNEKGPAISSPGRRMVTLVR
jgi:hypothetical protein